MLSQKSMEAAMERIRELLPVGAEDPLAHKGARRQSTRFPLNADVSIVEPVEADGFVINASVGGLRIAVDREIPLERRCVADVHFELDRRSREHCRVVWSRELADGWLVGLEFVSYN